MAEHIGLPSDQYMREDAESMKWIKRYANDQDAFFTDFVDAYLRLTRLGLARLGVTRIRSNLFI